MKKFNSHKVINLAIVLLIFLVVQVLISLKVISPFYQISLITIGINIILALGLNLIIGFTGQFSLGHAGFMAIGAYVTGVTLLHIPSYFGLFLGIVLGIIFSAIFGLIVALPTLRLKGDYLAIATLGFGEIVRIIILNMKVTGGASGLSNIPMLTNWTLVYFFIILTIVIIFNYIVSSSGRATVSIKDDEIASEAMGINTTKYKTIAFIIGGSLASIGGALYAANFNVLTPGTFNFAKSIDILVIVVFGGMGSLTGTIISAIVLGLINVLLQSFGAVRMILYSLALIGIMIFRPSGLLGTKELNLYKLFKKGGVKDEPSQN